MAGITEKAVHLTVLCKIISQRVQSSDAHPHARSSHTEKNVQGAALRWMAVMRKPPS